MNDLMKIFRDLCEEYRKSRRFQFVDVRVRHNNISVIFYSFNKENIRTKYKVFHRNTLEIEIQNIKDKLKEKQ